MAAMGGLCQDWKLFWVVDSAQMDVQEMLPPVQTQMGSQEMLPPVQTLSMNHCGFTFLPTGTKGSHLNIPRDRARGKIRGPVTRREKQKPVLAGRSQRFETTVV